VRWALVLVGLAVALPPRVEPPALESFYVARHFFSDNLSDSHDQILEVVSQGPDVRVRLIWLGRAHPVCGGLLVQAAERVLSRTTVQDVAGRNLCALDDTIVEAALQKAQQSGATMWESANALVGITCAGRYRSFEFPYDVRVNWKALRRRNPAVAAAGNLYYRVRERAFGKTFDFYTQDAGEKSRLEALGTAIVPDLRSRYEFDAPTAAALARYSGRPTTRLLPAELLERDSLTFETYVPAEFPASALSAHIFGDVHLRLTVDRETGAVTHVEETGRALPVDNAAAIDAARRWKFVPQSLTGDRVDVTLRFQPRCSH
jgi:hypothetical protein